MSLKKALFALVVFFISMNFSISVAAESYFDQQSGDYSVFQNLAVGIDEKANLNLIDEKEFYFGSFKKYENFLGKESQWIWRTKIDNKFYLYDEEKRSFQLFVDFDAQAGSVFPNSFSDCVSSTVISQRNLQLTVQGVKFNDVVRLDFGNDCLYTDLDNAFVSKSAGILKWTERQEFLHADEVVFELTDGIRNGEPLLSGGSNGSPQADFTFAATVPMLPVSLDFQDSIDVNLALDNRADSPLKLFFNHGYELDVYILGSQGKVVKRWSDGVFFLIGEHDLEIPAGSVKDFGVSVDLRDANYNLLPKGSYKLMLEFDPYVVGDKDRSADAGTPLYTAEYPLYID